MYRRNQDKKRRLLLYLFQQAAFFMAVLGVALLFAHSFAAVKHYVYYKGGMSTSHEVFYFDLFPSEKRFEDTEVFDEMLFSSLKDIIRFNILKSQMEEDGKFAGNKNINLDAFVNRKNPGESYGNLSYKLEDLLKWSNYGYRYRIVDYTELDFVFAFCTGRQSVVNTLHEIDNEYDGFLTENQKEILKEKYISYENLPEAEEYIADESIREIQDKFEKEYRNLYADKSGKNKGNEATLDVLQTEMVISEADGAGGSLLSAFFEHADVLAKNGLRSGEEYLELKVHQKFADTLLAVKDVVAGIYIQPDTGEIHVVVALLEELYKPVGYSDMRTLCADWKEYMENCAKLTQTVEELGYNYQEYLEFNQSYGEGKTNLRYDFRMTMFGKVVEISNIEKKEQKEEASQEDLEAVLSQNYRKYLYYLPRNIDLKTNTTGLITTSGLFQTLRQYEYAYPEDASIFIGLSKDYEVEDNFSHAAKAYSVLFRFRYLFFAMILFGILGFLVLFLYLTVTAPAQEEEERIWFDRLHTEFFVLIAGLCTALFLVMGKILYSLWNNRLYLDAHRMEMSFLTSLALLLCCAVGTIFWLSLIRRIKSGSLFQNSLLIEGIKRLNRSGRSILENMPSFLKTILYAGFIIGFNLFGGIWLCLRYFTRPSHTQTEAISLYVSIGVLVLVNLLILYVWFTYQVKRRRILKCIEKIKDGDVTNKVDVRGMSGENLRMAEAVNSIGDGIYEAVKSSVKNERLKTDLITNVSHDIKTPLTSIINYVDLIKRENTVEEPIRGYIEVLDKKSQRLKQLTDDLVEASKISSGNITLYMEKIDLSELFLQTIGEFEEKFAEKKLIVVDNFTGESAAIYADSRRMFRVVDNLFQNIYKYAMPGTRVYLDREEGEGYVTAILKNISAQPLNINADELTERFIRGDVSRNTEGSGLGLSIAKNLTELMEGEFAIYLDGDLFRISLTFADYAENEWEDLS